MPEDGTIHAHITGNMWAQDWASPYLQPQPYPGVGNLDVSEVLIAQHAAIRATLPDDLRAKPADERLTYLKHQADVESAVNRVRRAEDFYTSIGFPPLAKSFYEKPMPLRPRDRDASCHASAWPMDLVSTDMRIKMCIRPNEERQHTIYRETGHVYYDMACKDIPPICQSGANDGFHEAIGDAIHPIITPVYLAKIGLAGEVANNDNALLCAHMKLALE